MDKIFIIGTGRNGSKLSAHCLTANLKTKDTDLYGEIHHELNPIFFKKAYKGAIPEDEVIREFKISRFQAIKECQDIFIEKNHLIVPILPQVIKAIPDAKFLYIKRDTKAIVRSFMAREPYQPKNMQGTYGQGRLTPRDDDPILEDWQDHFTEFHKICWYVSEMTNMVEVFLKTLPKSQYKTIKYEQFIKDPSKFSSIYKWAGLKYNKKNIEKALAIRYGTKSSETIPEYKDWPKVLKDTYAEFFGKK